MEDGFWSSLMRRASVTPAEIKQAIDLVWLVERYGVMLTPTDEGNKWIGLCPFHEDSSPSFEVYRWGEEDKVGCWACDFGKVNDHFDFIAAINGGMSFTQARDEAIRLMEEAPAARRLAAVEAKAPKVNLAEFASQAVANATGDYGALGSFLHIKGMAIPPQWLIDQFRVGLTSADGRVVAPHMSADMDVTGVKVRRDHGFESLLGSKLDSLYGIWRARGHKRVVLVEGETDTWTVSYLLRDEDVDVLGLPSGVTAYPKPEWITMLRGKDVTLLFDADNASRKAAKQWREALGIVRLVRLREGEDATSVPRDELVSALSAAVVTGNEHPTYLSIDSSGGYVRYKADDTAVTLSNFALEPLDITERVDGQGGHVFRVRLPDGRTADIDSADMETDARLRRWANQWGYTWTGTTRDAQELLRALHMDSLFLPRLLGTSAVGLHNRTFVLPDDLIGDPGWRYVPHAMAIGVGDMIKIQPGPWDVTIPMLLSRLHVQKVITPIMGWVTASFLRPITQAFPILAVVGSAGWGKTTLVRTVLETFGSQVASTLTATTPHAVMAFLTSTNAVPVWFDEYRLGARDDSRKTFDQSLRDAWESSSSFKGGLKANLQEITRIPVSAPIVVTGEDAFVETSHLERMCSIRLPREGRNPEALRTLQAVDSTGFAYALLSWLMETLLAGALPAPPNIPSRPEHAQAVAQWGYSLLHSFAEEVCGYALPEYDGSMIRAAHDMVGRTPIVVEALRALEGRMSKQGPIVSRDEMGHFRVRMWDFVSECRNLSIPLPGGAQAILAELQERFDVTEEHDSYGAYHVVRGVPEIGHVA